MLNRHLHACGVGKLLLAEKRDVDSLLVNPLAALTDRTLTSRTELAERRDDQTELLGRQVSTLQEYAARLSPLLA